MVTVNGGPVAPDGVGGAYRNTDSDDRSALWSSLGGAQGMLSGGGLSAVAGSLAVSVAAFRAAVAERDSAGTLLDRGYHAWADAATTLTFDPPSAQARNDAVVLAVVDTSAGAGAFGSGVSEAGPQLLVVPGVSGTTTPRLDSDISTYVGSGGWVRLADVPINPGDTEVNTATWTLADAGAPLPLVQSGTVSISLTNQTTNTLDVVFDIPFADDAVTVVPTTDTNQVGANVFGNTITRTGFKVRAWTSDGRNLTGTVGLFWIAVGRRP